MKSYTSKLDKTPYKNK